VGPIAWLSPNAAATSWIKVEMMRTGDNMLQGGILKTAMLTRRRVRPGDGKVWLSPTCGAEVVDLFDAGQVENTMKGKIAVREGRVKEVGRKIGLAPASLASEGCVKFRHREPLFKSERSDEAAKWKLRRIWG
jgi:hypothetical protein